MSRAEKSSKFLKRQESPQPPDYFVGSEHTLSSILTTLSAPRKTRTKAQVEQLMSFTRNIKVFRELSEEMSSEAHYQCCECLYSAASEPGQVLSI